MPPWFATVIASVTSVVVAIISSQWFAKKLLKKDSIDEVLKRLDAIEIDYKEVKASADTTKIANVALLKYLFNRIGKEAIKNGYITIHDLEEMTALSVPYFELDDTDGSGHILLEKVKLLPLKQE